MTGGKLTICPHFIMDYTLTSPEDIAREIISPLHELFTGLDAREGVTLCMSNEILLRFRSTYPWQLMSDRRWKGHLIEWHTLITQNIVDRCLIIEPKNSQIASATCCTSLTQEVDDLFKRFLNFWCSTKLPNGSYEEGVFVSESNCASSSSFFVIYSSLDLDFLEYPWLQIYERFLLQHQSLPPEGDYPFAPPRDWRNFSHPQKGLQNGFLDKDGNEWVWDRLHNNHWDVQEGGGSYTNVGIDGSILG